MVNNIDGKKHVAKSGAKTGQLVACSAKNCRNGGEHVKDGVVDSVIMWKSKVAGRRVALREVSLSDVKAFEALPVDVRAAIDDLGVKRAAKLEAAKVKRDLVYSNRVAEERKFRASSAGRRAAGESASVRESSDDNRRKAARELQAKAEGSSTFDSNGDIVRRLYSENDIKEYKLLLGSALKVLNTDSFQYDHAVRNLHLAYSSAKRNSGVTDRFDANWANAVIERGAMSPKMTAAERIDGRRVISSYLRDVEDHVLFGTTYDVKVKKVEERMEGHRVAQNERARRASIDKVIREDAWAAAEAKRKQTTMGKFKEFLASWSYTEDTSRK